ncbi:MAG: lipopolysaccharide biosynthesis protein [Pirellulales bacterium]
MKPITRFAVNATTGWSNVLVGGAAAMLTVGLLVRELSHARYGITVLLNWLVIMLLMVDVGIRTAMGRQLAEHIAAGNSRRVNELITSVVVAFTAGAAMMQVIVLATAGPLVDVLNVTGPDRPTTVLLVCYFVVPYALMQFITAILGALVEAEHRFDLADGAHIAEVVSRTILIFAIVGWLELDLHGWAAAMLASKVVGLSLAIVAAIRVVPTLRVTGRHLRRDAFTELAPLAGVSFVQQIFLKFTAQTDPPVLSNRFGPSAVAYYAPALFLVTFAQPFPAVLSRQLRPLTTAYYTQGRFDMIRELLVRGTRLGTLMTVPFTVLFLAFAFPIVHFWLGPGYEITSWTLIAWALADFSLNATSAQWQVMLGINHVRFLTAVQTVCSTLNVACSVVLVVYARYAGWPLLWAIPAIVVPTIFFNLLRRSIITVHVVRTLDVPLAYYLNKSFVSGLVIALLLAGLAFGLQWVVPAETRMVLIAEVGLTVLVWVPLTWAIGLDQRDRQRVQELWAGLSNRVRGVVAQPSLADQNAVELGDHAALPLATTSSDLDTTTTVSDAVDQTTEESSEAMNRPAS